MPGTWRLTAPGDPATIAQFRALDALQPGARVLLQETSPRAFCELVTACWDRRLTVTPLGTDPAAPVARHLDPHLILSDGEIAVQQASLPSGDGGLAFIVYTSGSTGDPKGVMLSRAAVRANATDTGGLHGFGPDTPHATCLPLHHCNALIGSVIGAYLARAPLTVTAPFHPHRYSEAISGAGASTATIVPALLNRWLAAGTAWPRPLRYLITAAAPLTTETARWFQQAHGPRLRQGYGMTEACNFSFLMPFLNPAQFTAEYVDQRPPVGYPLRGTDWRIQDGEVQLKGPYVMRGYWRNPDATGAAFTEDGWLRTGDLGELRGHWLLLTGRAGDRINRGGEMIHPAEVEEAWERDGLLPPFAAARIASHGLGEDTGLWAETMQLATVRKLTRFQPAAAAFGPYPVTPAGKPRRNQLTAAGYRSAVTSPEQYEGLLALAVRCARGILAGTSPRTPSARYIAAQAMRLVNSRASSAWAHGDDDGPAADALHLLAAEWPRIATGEITGEQAIRTVPGLWRRLMSGWPMGDYADLMASHLLGCHDLALNGAVLELGAGIGRTSRLLAGHTGIGYMRSDLHPGLLDEDLPGIPAMVNFDADIPAPPWQPDEGWDLIFATNALHCALDRTAAIGRASAALAPGGVLVLAEGAPETVPGVPWALNLLFGMFTGWHDRGGFRSRWDWLEDLAGAGLGPVGYVQLRAGRHDLGGVVWAAKPAR